MNGDDDLLFAAEEGPAAAAAAAPPWPLLIVDDEPEVHSVTRLVLADYAFRGRTLDFVSAYSAREAEAQLAERSGFAIVLLDVVMETERAGLDLVRFIRERQGDRFIRIILRTGQPGHAPEREVIVAYDINDYKEKSELTAPRLFTAVTAALRGYEDLLLIERHRAVLSRIVAASAALLRSASIDAFLTDLVPAFARVFDIADDGVVCWQPRGAGFDDVRIAGASGRFAGLANRRLDDPAVAPLRSTIEQALAADAAEPAPGVVPVPTGKGHRAVIVFPTGFGLDHRDNGLVDVFRDEIAVSLDNIYLVDQLQRSERATVLALAKAAEFKDEDTGQHVQRVCALATAVARTLRQGGPYAGLIDDTFIDLIGPASELHDVGKVGVPDAVLRKEGPLDEADWTYMHRHPTMGHDILRAAADLVDGDTFLSLGAEIAAAHHERFDGKGYPAHLAGERIPLAARILSVVDVFDALTSPRSYKKPWPVERAVALLREQAGRQFDPVVVEAFVAALRAGVIAGGGDAPSGDTAAGAGDAHDRV